MMSKYEFALSILMGMECWQGKEKKRVFVCMYKFKVLASHTFYSSLYHMHFRIGPASQKKKQHKLLNHLN